MPYYAKSAIKFDGQLFKRGDEVPESIPEIKQLLNDGVVSDFPVEPDAEVAAPEEAAHESRISGGGEEHEKTGEPSIDGEGDRTPSRGPAADVSPGTASREGFLGRVFGKKEGGAPAAPERGAGDQGNGGAVEHVVTEEDVAAHPEITENGLKVGDVVKGKAAETLNAEAKERSEANV